uniref:(California timema) hypothetical protein n=1 Tax=Timema californicum TaxID=61474 RepID=A0A7R9J025_TIMCA|nr:unnamed protein product [Timema californicum]
MCTYFLGTFFSSGSGDVCIRVTATSNKLKAICNKTRPCVIHTPTLGQSWGFMVQKKKKKPQIQIGTNKIDGFQGVIFVRVHLVVLIGAAFLLFQAGAVPVETPEETPSTTSEKTVNAFIVKTLEFAVGILEDDSSEENSTETNSTYSPKLITEKWINSEVTYFIPPSTNTSADAKEENKSP